MYVHSFPQLPAEGVPVDGGHRHGQLYFFRVVIEVLVPDHGILLVLLVDVLLVTEPPGVGGVPRLPMVEGSAGDPHHPLPGPPDTLLFLVDGNCVGAVVPAVPALDGVGAAGAAAVAAAVGAADHALGVGAGPGPGVAAEQGADAAAASLHHPEPPPAGRGPPGLHLPPPAGQLAVRSVGTEQDGAVAAGPVPGPSLPFLVLLPLLLLELPRPVDRPLPGGGGRHQLIPAGQDAVEGLLTERPAVAGVSQSLQELGERLCFLVPGDLRAGVAEDRQAETGRNCKKLLETVRNCTKLFETARN